MSSLNYSKCLSATLKWEGGYSNHPDDPGGATNYGVIQVRYNEYRKDVGLPTRSVKQITKAERDDIYRRYYWDVVKGDDLPAGVDLVVFDYGVNSGPSRSIKHLQEVLGVSIDGKLGPETLKAVYRTNPRVLVSALMDRRQRFVRGLSIYRTFGKGWENRIKDIRKVALSMTTTTVIPKGPVFPDNKDTTTRPFNLLESIIRWLASFLKS